MNEPRIDAKNIQTRWLIRRDIPEVLEIENRSTNLPWTEHDFHSSLKQRNVIGIVAESVSTQLIFGFMLYGLHPLRLELINIAVPPEIQRTGVGRTMIDKLIGKLSQSRRRLITADIHEQNVNAQLFLARCGFKAQSTSHGDIHFQFRLPGTTNHKWQPKNRITQLFD